MLVLPGGGSFTLDHDFVVANPAFCPDCIEQIEVGLAGTANYQTVHLPTGFRRSEETRTRLHDVDGAIDPGLL